jgi:pyruvate/2-oxoglutarate dehydrogenase complex dihydrolipoamide acyltransferase (E2) component
MKKIDAIIPTLANLNSWSMADIMTPSHMVSMTTLASAKKINQTRDNFKQQGLAVPSYTAIIIKAVYLTLKKNPELNRAILGPPFFRRIIQFHNYDINVAVEKNIENLPGQAYAPTITNVDKKNVIEISKDLRFFADCDEKNDNNYKLFMRLLKFVPGPFSKWIINLPYWIPSLWVKHKGCACWVNSPARAGADLVLTTWPWPVTFSFGVVKKRPMVIDDQVSAELTIPLVMVFDRRLMGGGPAGRIFADFKQIIEEADPKLFE